MQAYRNHSGKSPIVGFQINGSEITVEFKGGKRYRYTQYKPGPIHVAEMQRLAQAGAGLAAYIGRHVQSNYEAIV